MCDPKSHCKCINKGILWINNNNSGVIPPGIIISPSIDVVPSIRDVIVVFGHVKS